MSDPMPQVTTEQTKEFEILDPLSEGIANATAVMSIAGFPTQAEVNDSELNALDMFASELDKRGEKHGPMILRLIDIAKRLPDEDHL